MMHLTVSYVPLSAEPLFVRAMIVFSRRDEMHLPVTRCPNHRMLRSGKCELYECAVILIVESN